MKRLKRYFMLLLIILHGGGYRRAEYLKRKNYFNKIGNHCYLQPYNFGAEPKLISFGDNVHVASNVLFINHDITSFMFSFMDNKKYKQRFGTIEIGDNVFIGANSTILYDVKIGNNVIIGAGSLVNKDIPNNTIVAGVPCKVIDNFEKYKKKLEIKE